MWLSLKLGCPHVEQVLEAITPEEFREWYAYWALNGEGRGRWNHAEVIAELINLPVRYAGLKAGVNTSRMQVNAYDLVPEPYKFAKPENRDDEETTQAEQLARHLGCI